MWAKIISFPDIDYLRFSPKWVYPGRRKSVKPNQSSRPVSVYFIIASKIELLMSLNLLFIQTSNSDWHITRKHFTDIPNPNLATVKNCSKEK